MRPTAAQAHPPLTYDALAGILGLRQRADVPCPECGPQCSTKVNARKPVLRIWRKDEGFLTFLCARCGLKGYVHERSPDWRRRIPADLPTRRAPIVVPDQAEQERDRIDYALSLFRAGKRLEGTLGESYLNSRGIRLDEDLHHVLRFHPALIFEGRKTPGIVALFRDIVTDEPRAVHRIFLTHDGHKIDRRMLGPVAHAAIKLDQAENVVSGLHIGEGIETCLAARQLGFRPTWALGSAGAISAFPVLAGIEAISVLHDDDAASDKAITTLADRYEDAGAEVIYFKGPDGKGDMNDLIMKKVAA
jgi:hypothetical protein